MYYETIYESEVTHPSQYLIKTDDSQGLDECWLIYLVGCVHKVILMSKRLKKKRILT